jgi:hypothetical protein
MLLVAKQLWEGTLTGRCNSRLTDTNHSCREGSVHTHCVE